MTSALIIHPTATVPDVVCRPHIPEGLDSLQYVASYVLPEALTEFAQASYTGALREVLTQLGVVRVEIDYSGYADSGDIDAVRVFDPHGEVEVNDQTTRIGYWDVRRSSIDLADLGVPAGCDPDHISFYRNNGVTDPLPTRADAVDQLRLGTFDGTRFRASIYRVGLEVAEQDGTLTDLLHDWAFDLVEGRHGGWEINDGSDGSIVVDVASGSITHTHNTNYTAQDTETHVTPLAPFPVAQGAVA